MKVNDEALQRRFLAKVSKSDGCWLWAAGVNKQGYGTFSVNKSPRLAHRVSYTLHVGVIPDGTCVLHRCDVPACVNPDHLFLGSLADNNRDMREKGRASGGSFPGELAPLAKLTADQVRDMRVRFRLGQCPQAAQAFGVSHACAWQIITRRTWVHI